MNAHDVVSIPVAPRAALTINLSVQRLAEVGADGTVAIGPMPAGTAAVSARSDAGAHAGPDPTIAAREPTPERAGLAPENLTLAERLTIVLQPPRHPVLEASTRLTWPGTFFDYQLTGIHALLTRGSLLLADDMGLGKTIQAIAALRILALQRQVSSALIIVPASLVSQWRRELRTWAPDLRVSTVSGPAADRAWQWDASAHVYLTSYETFRSDFTGNAHSPPRRRVWDLLILDEAQKIKNRDTDVSRKCKQLRRRRTWALTGTPLENSEEDLASVLEVVVADEGGVQPVRLWPGTALRERHASLQLRRRKLDVLPELPPKSVSNITLTLEGEQRASYERAEREGIVHLREAGASIRIEHVLALIIKLKQICNFCPKTGRSAKADDVRERLAVLESEGHRALVFSQFTDRNHGARAIVRELGAFRPLLYTGDLAAPERDAVLGQFRERDEHRVLVLSLRAGGQGLNLQEASYVFHFDRWWNPAVERQAEDRTHRLGQTNPVTVYSYTMEGTIEERIAAILRTKQLLFDEIVDEVSLDLRSILTAVELFGIFGLAPPTSSG